ncbi:MAG: GNAT family N-acetyltransferase [Spirochaetes bacterium]|nr:GNAT family N-acetyltransferase [Spirochaetota bacterium]
MEIKTISVADIKIIQNLWEKLNLIHLNDSTYFKDHFESFTFDERCRSLILKDPSEINIEVLFDGQLAEGYCISTFSGESGGIDSIFVDEKFRKHGYGKELAERSIKWLKSNNCKNISVSVAEGHESVFSFYEKLGFYPRKTVLQMK